MDKNKTPGSDGLTKEFYEYFWDFIIESLYSSYDFSMINGHLSIEQRRGIIRLIPKKEKDLMFLKNWRPISLQNIDTKMLSLVIAKRFQKVLPDLIGQDQNGFLKNRFIGYNIRTIIDAIDYLNKEEQEGFLAFIDFEKAFDKLDWKFIDKTLEAFNFGDYIRNWIKIMYANIESCTINNGYKSRFFKILNGVRQGDPLSALLFILAVEILAIAIRSNHHIRGICIDGYETKISMLADDTTLLLADIISIRTALNVISLFFLASGLKINYDKSEILQIGRVTISYQYHKPFKLQWSQGGIKSLGIYYYNNISEITTINLSKKLVEFNSVLTRWSKMFLTLKGKITIIKSLALPKLLYITNVVWSPPWFVEEVNKGIKHFLWDGKTPRVQRKVLIQNYTEGGLRHIDYNIFLKTKKVCGQNVSYNSKTHFPMHF